MMTYIDTKLEGCACFLLITLPCVTTLNVFPHYVLDTDVEYITISNIITVAILAMTCHKLFFLKSDSKLTLPNYLKPIFRIV